MLQNIKPYKDHGMFQLEQISNSKAALQHLLPSVWVIYLHRKKELFPIFGHEQMNQLSDYLELKKKPLHFVSLNLGEMCHSVPRAVLSFYPVKTTSLTS